MALIMQLQWRR